MIKTKRFASGKYFVYIDGQRLPCTIVGGRGKFNLEGRNGEYLGTFKTVKLAAEKFVEFEKKIPVPVAYSADCYVGGIKSPRTHAAIECKDGFKTLCGQLIDWDKEVRDPGQAIDDVNCQKCKRKLGRSDE